MGFHGKKDDYDTDFTIMMVIKQGKLKCIKCTNKWGELHDVSTYYMKFLKYDLFLFWIEDISHV
jgi:hypothetical protein